MKVFVSSTTKDLGEARKKVCERLLQLDIQPVSMDWYVSHPNPPKKVDEAKVKECDAFVIIVGHLYGSSPPGEDRSFTELEYEAAVASGKPFYPFLATNEFRYDPDLREDDAANKKIRAFRELLTQKHSPRPFDNVDQLCAEVMAALAPVAKSLGKLLLPLPPMPYLAHPYPLQENFTGRLKERVMLTEWIRGADSKPLLSLVGMGGLGKSALTWYWLHEDLPQEKIRLAGVVWWSFYETESSFESFLSHALLYVGGGTIDPVQIDSDYDRMQSLWCILRDSPFLLIFDGTERLLRAYHALDAAYRGDDFPKQDQDRHLQCTNPQAGQFLQWLGAPSVMTRTLLTTRLQPKELGGLAGCRKEDLKRLDPDDAVEFMRRQGIKGPRNAIVHACEPYDFLPLCIRLLSGAIREDPENPNDIEAARDWHPPADLIRKEHHILQVAYDTMAKDRRDLFSRIAAMRGPVDYATAQVLSTYDNEDELKEALRELVTKGLLFRRESQAHYDLHPIVRQYAYDRLGDKAATHKVLKDYFDTVPKPDKIEGLDDLMPTIELFHHTIRAGGYEEAFRIYENRLAKPLYYQLGAYDALVSLARAFFPGGEDQPTQLKDDSAYALILNDLAMVYLRTGQSGIAMGLVERSNAIDENRGDKLNVAIGLGHLSMHQMLLGELKAAESDLRHEIKIDKEIGDKEDEARGHEQLGRLLTYMGRYGQADEELEIALRLCAEQDYKQGQCLSWSYRGLCEILMDEPKSALKAVQKARQFWKLTAKHQYPFERDLVEILWLSGTAKRCAGDATGAEADLNEALSRCRRIRLVEFEADILLEMAKLQWQKAQGRRQDTGDRRQKGKEDSVELIEQTKTLIREALEIADRCEYQLKQAGIHNFLAEMAFAEDDMAAALKHAEIARERACCDGPPHCYKKALDEAEQMLGKLTKH